jgi:hypothetical protein
VSRRARALWLLCGGWFSLERSLLTAGVGQGEQVMVATVVPGHDPALWDRLGPPPVRLT